MANLTLIFGGFGAGLGLANLTDGLINPWTVGAMASSVGVIAFGIVARRCAYG